MRKKGRSRRRVRKRGRARRKKGRSRRKVRKRGERQE